MFLSDLSDLLGVVCSKRSYCLEQFATSDLEKSDTDVVAHLVYSSTLSGRVRLPDIVTEWSEQIAHGIRTRDGSPGQTFWSGWVGSQINVNFVN